MSKSIDDNSFTGRGSGSDEIDCGNISEKELLDRLKRAYRDYKLSQMYLKDVMGDHRKAKNAGEHFVSARYKLFSLLEEARNKGIKLVDANLLHCIYPENAYFVHLEK